jgi:excisionase family DNA binding protein
VSTRDTIVTPTVRTPAEAAAILRVKQSWLERQAAARKIPFTMLGGAYRFTDEHLAEIVRMNEKVPAIREAKASEYSRRTPQMRQQSSGVSVMPLRPRPGPGGPRRKAAA